MCWGWVGCAPRPLLPAHTAPHSRSLLPAHGCSLIALPSGMPCSCPVAVCWRCWRVLTPPCCPVWLLLAAVPGAGAVPLPTPLTAHRRVWTRRRLMFTLSGAPCSLTGVGPRFGEEEGGLLRGLRLFAVDVIMRVGLSRAHPSWAHACSPHGLTCARRHALTRRGAGAHLTCLLVCWCTSMAHVDVFTHLVVAAAAALDTSHSGTGPGRAGREGEERAGCFLPLAFPRQAA